MNNVADLLNRYVELNNNNDAESISEREDILKRLTELSIVNLTQHNFTEAQTKAFTKVVDTNDEVKDFLTFEELPSIEEMNSRARRLAYRASKTGCLYAMIGGAPFFMGILVKHLKGRGITPLFAFSKIVVKEVTDPETGEVKKITYFRHEGWVTN